MSIPTSKVLRASKSIVAAVDLKHNSPTVDAKQQQNVNIVVNNSPKDQDENQLPEACKHYPEVPPIQVSTRDMNSVNEDIETLTKIMNEKDNIIKAQAIIIDMFQNNPVMVNKYIITTVSMLKELITLLTNASEVEIEVSDFSCDCLGKPQFGYITSIFVTVSGEMFSIDMCPLVLKLMSSYKISLSTVLLEG